MPSTLKTAAIMAPAHTHTHNQAATLEPSDNQEQRHLNSRLLCCDFWHEYVAAWAAHCLTHEALSDIHSAHAGHKVLLHTGCCCRLNVLHVIRHDKILPLDSNNMHDQPDTGTDARMTTS